MRLSWILSFSAVLFAQQLKLPPDMMQIVSTAHAAPAEFAADALLRVVESGKVSDKTTRRQLIQDAFQSAVSAHLRSPMRVLAGVGPDTRADSLGKAYALKLDTISLQTRAVRAMLGVDKAAARELFAAIPRPAPAAVTCESPLAPDPADLYRTLGTVVQSAFSPGERKKEEHVQFLLSYAGQAASPAEAASLAEVIAGAGLTPDQLQEVRTRLNINAGSMAPEGAACKDVQPVTELYWQSDAAKQILTQAKELRFKNGALLSEADRAGSQWQEQLADFLKNLADWSAAQEKSEADFYHEKSIVYEALIELTPAGPERDKLLEAFVGFIGNSNMQSQSPAEWFVHAKALLERVRNSNNGQPDKVLSALEASGNPALAVYVALERAFGSRTPSWVTSAIATPVSDRP